MDIVCVCAYMCTQPSGGQPFRNVHALNALSEGNYLDFLFFPGEIHVIQRAQCKVGVRATVQAIP